MYPFRYLWLARSFLPVKAGWTGALLLALIGFAQADTPVPVTLDLPLPANLVTPSWLGQPDMPATDFATLNLPILTPDSTSSLLVTVYFQEKTGGFMRISWKGTQNAQVLSDNFYENIGIANQRSLLISPSTLVGDGILSFQCGDSTLGIQRIKLEWLENKNSLVSPDVRDLLVTPSVGPTQTANSANGQPNPSGPGAWEGDIVAVPLTDQPVRIEDGVEFSVDLDKTPISARLVLKEAGLPLGHHLVVWVNQQRAGTITPTVPDLLDGGFLTTSSSSSGATYEGWRDATFYVPVTLLKAGENDLLFSEEDDATLSPATAPGPVTTPLAIKAFVMQLNYQTPPPPPTTDAAVLPSFSIPSGPIAPAGPTSPSTPTSSNAP